MSDTYEELAKGWAAAIKTIDELETELSRQSDHFATVCGELEGKILELKESHKRKDTNYKDICENFARQFEEQEKELSRLTTERDVKEKVVEAAKASRNASNPDEMQHSLLLLSDALDTHDSNAANDKDVE